MIVEEKAQSKLQKLAVEKMLDSLVYHSLLKPSLINYLRSLIAFPS